MLEWLWICMVISFKAAVGSFLWVIAIALGSMGLAFFFGVVGSLIALVSGGGDNDKDN